MHRHRVVTIAASAILLIALAGCGGSSASPSAAASTEAPTEVPVTAAPPSVPAPSGPAASASAAPHTTATAACAGVALRKEPKSDGEVILRARAGTKVRVVEVVVGDAYKAGTCGMSGNSWLKVDRIGGKSIKVQYGVPFGFVAAGFFQ